MKTFLKRLGLVLLCLVTGLWVLALWMSQTTQPPESYIQKHIDTAFLKTDTTALQDSIYSIITYNIGYLSDSTNNSPLARTKALFENGMQRTQQAFLAYHPDIIAYQEIDFNSERSFEINQSIALAKALRIPFRAEVVNWDKRYVPFPYFPISGHFGRILSGQAIHSTGELLTHERIVLERPETPIWYDAFYIERLAQVTKIKLEGKTVIVINVHLEAYDKPTRLRQSEYVLSLYKKYHTEYPVLLVGDFNSDPFLADDPTINVFLEESTLASACTAPEEDKSRCTYPATDPSHQIDYIFYNPKFIEGIDWKVIEEVGTASDHMPLLFRFKLNR